MSQFTLPDLKTFAKQVRRDFRDREKRMVGAARQAARETARVVRQNAPRAFGELADSVHVEKTPTGGDVVVDAPHAAAVEVGSRPHWAPLAPLIAWVRQRGMLGLTRSGRVIKNRTRLGRVKDPRREASRAIAEALRARVTVGVYGLGAGATPVDAAVELARAIQAKIAKNGTKPTHFVGDCVPFAEAMLARLVEAALPDEAPETTP